MILNDHDYMEKAPEQQIVPLKPSSEEKTTPTKPSQGSDCSWFLKADMQMWTEVTF